MIDKILVNLLKKLNFIKKSDCVATKRDEL